MINLTSKRGVTLVALIITFILLSILIGVTVTTGTSSLKAGKDSKLKSELTMVQHAILEQYAKFQTTKDTTYLVGVKVNKSVAQQYAEDMGASLVSIPTNYLNQDYYQLNNSDLQKIGIQDTDDIEDVYIVNYVSGEVMNITQKKTSENEPLYTKANSFVQ